MKIEKVGKNDYKVTPIRKIKDAKTGKDVEIYDDRSVVHYGLKKVLLEQTSLEKQKEAVLSSGYIDTIVKRIDSQLSALNEIVEVIKADNKQEAEKLAKKAEIKK